MTLISGIHFPTNREEPVKAFPPAPAAIPALPAGNRTGTAGPG